MSNRILETSNGTNTITGRDAAEKEIASCVSAFNDCNGGQNGYAKDRMKITASGLAAYDDAGSGEFYEAVCLNLNTAESCDAEIYQIETAW